MGAHGTKGCIWTLHFFCSLLLALSCSAALEAGDIVGAGLVNMIVIDGKTLAMKAIIPTPCAGSYIGGSFFSNDLKLFYAPCVSADNLIYVMNATDPALPIIRTITSPHAPYSVAVDRNDNIYANHIPANSQVDIFAPNGTLLDQIPGVNINQQIDNHIALNTNQTILLATSIASQNLLLFDIRTKSKIGSINVGQGHGCGQTQAMPNGNVLQACDACVRVFAGSLDGTMLGQYCGHIPGTLALFYGVAIDPSGDYFYASAQTGYLYKIAFANMSQPVSITSGYPMQFWELAVYGQAKALPCNTAITITPPANSIWPSNKCVVTPQNGRCTAICNPGYRSNTGPPTSTCNQGVFGPVTGTCLRACEDAPSVALPGGSWPASCAGTPEVSVDITNKTVVGTCYGICGAGNAGSPSVQCSNGRWLTNITGACRPKAVCVGLPSVVIVNGVWPESCRDGVLGYCSAQCNAGYTAGGPATVQCTADGSSPSGARWGTTVTGACNKACDGTPSVVLPGGSWPAGCANTPVLATSSNGSLIPGICSGVCDAGNAGSPFIQCLNGVWSSTFFGACRPKPVCVGLPPAIIANGVWPESCRDSPLGVCTAQCNAGYTAGGPATVQCTADGSSPSGARWGTTVTGACNKGK